MGQRQKVKYGPADIARACGHENSRKVLLAIKDKLIKFDYLNLRETAEYIVKQCYPEVKDIINALKREQKGKDPF